MSKIVGTRLGVAQDANLSFCSFRNKYAYSTAAHYLDCVLKIYDHIVESNDPGPGSVVLLSSSYPIPGVKDDPRYVEVYEPPKGRDITTRQALENVSEEISKLFDALKNTVLVTVAGDTLPVSRFQSPSKKPVNGGLG